MGTNIKNSRMIPFSDVPEVKGFTGKFVYNFFVPDELNNDDGKSRFHGALDVINESGQVSVVDNYGHQVDISTINAEVPRFVELDWQPSALIGVDSFFDAVLGEDGFLEKHFQLYNDEGSMNSPIDAQMRTRDSELRSRLIRKIKLFDNITKPAEQTRPSTLAELVSHFDNVEDVDSEIVNNLLSKLAFADTGYVNERKVVDRTSQFLQAESFNVYSNVDRRVGFMIFNPIFNQDAPGISKYKEFYTDNSLNHALLKNESQKAHFELGLKVLPGKTKLPMTSPQGYEAVPVGYVIERTQPTGNGLFSTDPKIYYVDGADNTKFFDTEIVYSRTYRYKITAIYAVKLTVAIADDPASKVNDAGFYRMLALVKSKQSKSVILKTEELIPPADPDGVLYRYNYDQGTGLLINWQMPVGKQRDIKYFQVFRRRSIKEPFTCIAELDFNDAIIAYKGKAARKIERLEKVRSDRIYEFDFPRTFFNDARFDRRSKFIYAIAAVDAHGLTSGYSAQTEVGFDRNKNRLTLKTISRPGAPKQYPNFFIDPTLDDNFAVDSLTTDAMLTSKKQTMKIYFDPDAKTVKIPGNAESNFHKSSKIEKIVKSKNKDGDARYVMNILNVDRQVAKNLSLSVTDVRSD